MEIAMPRKHFILHLADGTKRKVVSDNEGYIRAFRLPTGDTAISDDPDYVYFYDEDPDYSYDSKLNPEAADYAFLELCKSGTAAEVRAAIDAGADVNARDRDGWTPLGIAAGYNDADAVRVLLDAGAYVHIRDGMGWTPLMQAAAHNKTAAAQVLLDAGADVNARDTSGLSYTFSLTTLMIAARANDKNMVRLLLDAGADIRARDKEGKTALSYAEKGDTVYAILRAAALAAGMSVDGDDTDGDTGYNDYVLMDLYADGRAAEVRAAIDAGADVNKRHGLGRTALMLALHWNDCAEDMVRVLLDAGADVNAADDYWGRTPLIEAADRNNTAVVQLVLDAGADVNAADGDGRTPLMFAASAARSGNADMVQLLLDAGADIRARDNNGKTALDYARKDTPAYVLLRVAALAAGMNVDEDGEVEDGGDVEVEGEGVNVEDGEDDTGAGFDNEAFFALCAGGTAEEVRAAIDAGADVNAADVDGWTPLMLAAGYASAETIRVLLDAGADVRTADSYGQRVLTFATYTDNIEAIRIFLDAGADVNARDEFGMTPFVIAACYSYVEAMQILLDAGADVNVVGSSGYTPLMWAARNNNRKAVQMLLDAGADIRARDDDGDTALDILVKNGMYGTKAWALLLEAAGMNGNVEVEGEEVNVEGEDDTGFDYAEDGGFDATAFLVLCKSGTAADVRAAIDAGADVNARDRDGWTPLIVAAGDNDAATVRVLLDAGADVNMRGVWGWTPLMSAAGDNDADTVRVLLDAGADVNTVYEGGVRPLMRAVAYNKTATAQLLLDVGEDVNAVDDEGWTPLRWAARAGDEDMVRLLLDAGADISARDKDGNTALDILSKNGMYGTKAWALLAEAAGIPRDVAGEDVEVEVDTGFDYAEDGGFETAIIDGTVTITKYTGSAADVIIPERIDGLRVTAIGDEAFQYSGLEFLRIPKGVTAIGDRAFYYCEKLTAITLPLGVKTIGAGAFWQCKRLASVELPDSVTLIGKRAFAGCYNLAAVTIPDGVTRIREATFLECTGLTSITIPAGVEVIESGAFEYCENLARVSLSRKTKFGRRVFPDTAVISFYDDATGVYAAEKGARADALDLGRRGTYPAPWGGIGVCTPECNFSGKTTYPATCGVVDTDVGAEARLVPEDIAIFLDAWIALLAISDRVEEEEEWQDYIIALGDVDMSDEVAVFRETFAAFYRCPVPRELENIFRASGWDAEGQKKYSTILVINHICRLTRGVQQFYGEPAYEEMLKEMAERDEELLRIFHPDDIALVRSRFDDIEARQSASMGREE